MDNLDVDFPIGGLSVVCGPSGSGKTTLVINTLFAESQRRFIETVGTRRRGKFSLWKRPDLDSIENLPPAATASEKVDLNQTLAQLCGMDDALALAFSRYAVPICPHCGIEVPSGGAASAAEYFESFYANCRALIAFVPSAAISEYAQRGFSRWLIERDSKVEMVDANELAQLATRNSQLATPYVLADRLAFKPGDSRTKESFELAFAESGGKAVVFIETPEGTVKRYAGQGRTCPQCGQGFSDSAVERFYLSELPKEPSERDKILAYQLDGKNLLEWYELSADQIVASSREPKAAPCYSNYCLLTTAYCLQDCGLGYMSLSRKAETMSGGQIRRAEMAAMFAGDLVNMLYVFDEPMDGVPPENRPALLSALLRLRDRGNTVVVADNDASLIQAADCVVQLAMSNEQLAISNVEAPQCSRPSELRITNSKLNIAPIIGKITAITGRAGAGKSMLLAQLAGKPVLPDLKRIVTGQDAFEDVILVERKLERKPPRGCVAMYLGIWDSVRAELASTPESQARGFVPGDFSLMSGKGRCQQCKGEGVLTIDLEYLPEIEMVCSECMGERFQKEYLQPRFRGLNAAEILRLTVRDAFSFFRNIRSVQLPLTSLIDIGLERLELGQPIKTLSAGERSRLDLAKALQKIYKQKTLFLLDEPSAGLHDSELDKLIETFRRLTAYGHTVVMIENNPWMIQQSNVELRVRE
ncbi:MAG: hypothetical protein IJG38_15435 [Thermoguttaceae bacterium]|nr:hypothetical protein [Thermoguttaceae bacterium]